jgi:bile acid:Na+ symporter, BASS family
MLLISLKASIGVLIFAVGMTATTDDIIYLWRRPVLLAKSVTAMYVVMPAAAVLMAYLLDLPPRTELSLVILAICAGAPLLPKSLIQFGGDPSYVFSLIVTTSLLAIVTVPVSLYILTELISFNTKVLSTTQVARVILKTFLLPIGLGMIFRHFFPLIAEGINGPLLKISSTVMVLCSTIAMAIGIHLVFYIGLPSLLAFALFTSVAIIAGHLLGGPDPSCRTSLSIACSSRHIGLALLFAVNARSQRVLSLVVAYLFASGIVSIFYVIWIKRFKRLEKNTLN